MSGYHVSRHTATLDFGGLHPVFQQTTKSGFQQRIYVMYHGTPAVNLESILRDGFKNSNATGKLLGAGIYVSKDIEKTEPYSTRVDGCGVILKLLVYPGKVKRITEPDDPVRITWHQSHNSAWIPAGCNLTMVPSGKEENCVKSRSQVRVLGVCRGFGNLSGEVRRLTCNVSGGTGLDERERKVLHSMLVEEGILYCHVAHVQSERFLHRIVAPGPDRISLAILEALGVIGGDAAEDERQLWTRSWDLCLENKSDGSVLEIGPDGRLLCNRVVTGRTEQNFRIDKAGKLLNKPQGKAIVSLGGGPDLVAKRYSPMSDQWKFVSFDDHWTLQ